MPKFDVVSVGNAKIDEFLSIHKATQHLRLNKDTNELCIKSGEKITVDKCDFLLGGNAANVAVGLSRLGLNSSICVEIGDDEFSQKIIKALTEEKVNIDLLKQSNGQPSSFSVILNFQNERTIFSEHIRRAHNFTFDDIKTKWIYLTSIGNEWKNAYKNVTDYVLQSKCFLAFNPGTLQIEAGRESIVNVLSITNILFVNKEEAVEILNMKYEILNIKEVLIKLQKLGPKIVVITDGDNGSYAIDEKGQIFMHDIYKTRVVEKTGAGDAYSTGFLAAILHGLSIKDAMAWGALNSASVIEKTGAQAGLLTRGEMQEGLKRISNY